MRWWEFEVMPKPNATEEKKKMDSFQQFDETTPRTMHLTWDTSKRKKKKNEYLGNWKQFRDKQ